MPGNVHTVLEGKVESNRLFVGPIAGKGIRTQRDVSESNEKYRADEKLLVPRLPEAEGDPVVRKVSWATTKSTVRPAPT
jgi:hypothetical protein